MTSNKSAKPGRPKLPDARYAFVLVLFCSLCFAGDGWAKELRRSMSFIRPWLMGDAYVAVADESSMLFYNPAGLAGLGEPSAEVFNFQLNGDERVKTALLDPDNVQSEFQNVDQTEFRSRLGETFFVNFNMRLPIIVRPESGIAFGLGIEFRTFLEILGNPILPSLRLELVLDRVMFFSKSFKVTENFLLGFTTKAITRIGIDKTLTFGELFAAGTGTVSLDNDPAFNDLQNGRTFTALGLDLGLLYHLPLWKDWDPRVGLSALNIGGGDAENFLRGMEFGPRPDPFSPPQAGELPQINTIGFAVSPIVANIRFTMAFDVVDYSRTVLPGENWKKRSRLGFEMGIGPKKDGTALFSVLAGLNANHFSAGILSRVWIFEIGFGNYTVELGDKSGDNPDKRFLFFFGVRI